MSLCIHCNLQHREASLTKDESSACLSGLDLWVALKEVLALQESTQIVDPMQSHIKNKTMIQMSTIPPVYCNCGFSYFHKNIN